MVTCATSEPAPDVAEPRPGTGLPPSCLVAGSSIAGLHLGRHRADCTRRRVGAAWAGQTRKFPFPRFPIWQGIGDSRRESRREFPIRRGIGESPAIPLSTLPCEYSSHDSGLDVALYAVSPSNCGFCVHQSPPPQLVKLPFERTRRWKSRLGRGDGGLWGGQWQWGNPKFPGPIRRESGNRESPFPDSAGTGNRGPDGGGPGISWSGAGCKAHASLSLGTWQCDAQECRGGPLPGSPGIPDSPFGRKRESFRGNGTPIGRTS
jgi:hypothetical protein